MTDTLRITFCAWCGVEWGVMAGEDSIAPAGLCSHHGGNDEKAQLRRRWHAEQVEATRRRV